MMQLSDYLAKPAMMKRYIEVQRNANKFARQGNTEPIFGKGRLTAGVGGVIAAGTRITALQDELNQFAAGGIALTRADASAFGGKVPSGQWWLLRGMGFAIHSETAQASDQDVNVLTANISAQLDLRGTPVNVGNLMVWPSVYGARGTGNGNNDGGVPSFNPYIVLKALETFTVTYTVERAVTISGGEDATIDITCMFPASRIFDPEVLGRS